MRWTCESISTTESTSSTATIVTNNIESKEQCNVKLSIFLKFIQRANEYSAPLVRMSELSLVHNMTLVRASRRERRERRERQFVNYPASVSVGERWLTLE